MHSILYFIYYSWIIGKILIYFDISKILYDLKSEPGVCLAMCLKFPEFEAWCAYKLGAYKKKSVFPQSSLHETVS